MIDSLSTTPCLRMTLQTQKVPSVRSKEDPQYHWLRVVRDMYTLPLFDLGCNPGPNFIELLEHKK